MCIFAVGFMLQNYKSNSKAQKYAHHFIYKLR